MGTQVQFDNRLLWPAIWAGVLAALVSAVGGEPLVRAAFLGLGIAVFVALLLMVFAYPLAWYMKLRAVDGLSRARATFALLWRLSLATALTVLLTSLILAAKFLNAFLPEWLQIVLTILIGGLMWYSIIQDLRAARRERRSPVVDLGRSRSLVKK